MPYRDFRATIATMEGLGRTALVTGVSRPQGIGRAIAERLVADGARVFAQGWSAHDAAQRWCRDAETVQLDAGTLPHVELDLGSPDAPAGLVRAAVEQVGLLDALVVNHARSSQQSLDELTAAELDQSWAVNVRAALLLVQAFAAQYVEHPHGGRVVLFTSGQHRGPMPAELPYVATKGALHQLTSSLSDALVDRGITVNCVNPGPTDTGWATDDVHRSVTRAMPRGRWNSPADAAAVVALLLSADAATVTGQVLDAEGGFRRSG